MPARVELMKTKVREFWNEQSCGEALHLAGEQAEDYDNQARARYALEPYILEFAAFERYRGQRVLEVGVGLGADHEQFAAAGAELSGIDLTPRAIDHTRRRLARRGLSSRLAVGDAEQLQFDDDSFDLVYSWGVIHHAPDTWRAAEEILRVTRPGGEFKVMIYQKYSLIGLMLWLRFGLGRLRPFCGLEELYGRYLESPGTKAFTVAEARALFAAARQLSIRTALSSGDLLTGGAGQRHRGPLLSVMRALWPRGLIRRGLSRYGLFMMVHGVK